VRLPARAPARRTQAIYHAGRSVGESESLLREEIEGKRRLYTALAVSVPRGEIRLIDAGHVTLHLRCPGAVVQTIQDLLGR